MDAASKAAMVGFLHEFDLSTDTGMTPVEEVFENNAPHNGLLLCESLAERTKLKANERRDRYRKKLRDERETLRLQERELSAKLSRLQEADAKAKEEEKKMNTLALSSWRATALRQKEKRLEAEYLQQQLKAAVRYRSELISHLNALLMKPVLTTDLTCENHL
ncbi:hypothetical protein PHPALM_27630 [Phytophthora palmivora]|uniref:Uncharacterized protein n=1 Tax=Phytophthora palmivora TaxID=4796 RepID=A0A2P4XC40_9STRA|nr:hypothetical protein PHPALM_27630 [Phytophthora palmivora]